MDWVGRDFRQQILILAPVSSCGKGNLYDFRVLKNRWFLTLGFANATLGVATGEYSPLRTRDHLIKSVTLAIFGRKRGALPG